MVLKGGPRQGEISAENKEALQASFCQLHNYVKTVAGRARGADMPFFLLGRLLDLMKETQGTKAVQIMNDALKTCKDLLGLAPFRVLVVAPTRLDQFGFHLFEAEIQEVAGASSCCVCHDLQLGGMLTL